MKLLSVNLARSVWFGNIAEFNPTGLNLYPMLIRILVDTYKFKKYPSDKEVLDEKSGVKFEYGEFISKDGNAIIVNLTIFLDGIWADTRSSTNDSDAFLTEILTRFAEDFKLPHYKQIITRIGYASQLHVSTDKSLKLINPKLNAISKYLTDSVLGFGEVTFEIGGISFWPEQANVNKPFNFNFERVLNVPFSENKYFSAAPLQTDKHLELLDRLEMILSK